MLQIIFCLRLVTQTPLLDESFTNAVFPPPGWDTLRSDTGMGTWYRYYYSTGYPDIYHARVRVYDALNIYRTGFSSLITPVLDLSGASGPESLFFWYRFSRYDTNLGPDDTVFIDISNDQINWYSLYKISQSQQDTAWQRPRINLSAYDNYASARIRFHFVDEPNDSIHYQNANLWLDSVEVMNPRQDTILLINELFVDPVTYDHNSNNNFNDLDEEFIEIFNKNTYSITLTNYRISDYIGGNSLILTNTFNIPAYGYLLIYASGEGLIITGDGDTLVNALWTGSWPNLDQSGDTILLIDSQSREIDRKSYLSSDVCPDYTIARLPNGTETWINNAFPTPGQSNGDQYIWPIANAFQDLDSNYVPDFMDSTVTITGIITAPPGIYSDAEAYIQDNTGGVCLYGNFPLILDYGDSLLISGTIDQYRGKSELSDFTYSIIQHNALVPAPVLISGAILNTEAYEGMLISIPISYFDGLQLEGNTEYTAWDTLDNAFSIWIDSYTNIPGNLAPIDTFTITGIKGQYSYSTPPDDGYQLMPRSVNDFSHLFELPAMKTIAQVQTPGNDGVSSKYVDSIVCVQGVLIGPSYVFTSGSSPSFYIQDNTAGINIYGPEGDNMFNTYIDSLGALLTIVGTVTEYNGLTEISRGHGWFANMDTLPEPKELSDGRFITESMEGSLLQLRAVVQTLPYKSGDGYNFEAANGDVGIAVRFTSASGINPSSIQKDQELIITGIAGQYDYEAPFTSGYQILPRFPYDLMLPGFDSASAEPRIMINGPKTFIPEIGEQARIEINAPLDHRVRLELYDMNYRLLRTLYTGPGGPRTIFWNGNDDLGRNCPLGIYLLNLKSVDQQGKTQFRRMLVVLGTRF